MTSKAISVTAGGAVKVGIGPTAGHWNGIFVDETTKKLRSAQVNADGELIVTGASWGGGGGGGGALDGLTVSDIIVNPTSAYVGNPSATGYILASAGVDSTAGNVIVTLAQVVDAPEDIGLWVSDGSDGSGNTLVHRHPDYPIDTIIPLTTIFPVLGEPGVYVRPLSYVDGATSITIGDPDFNADFDKYVDYVHTDTFYPQYGNPRFSIVNPLGATDNGGSSFKVGVSSIISSVVNATAAKQGSFNITSAIVEFGVSGIGASNSFGKFRLSTETAVAQASDAAGTNVSSVTVIPTAVTIDTLATILPQVLTQTTDPAVAGQLWNNSGVVMISAG